jgi:hypothetical protein
MFSVIFEVHPKLGQWDAYLSNAKMLRPELESVDGFVDNIRFPRTSIACSLRASGVRSQMPSTVALSNRTPDF